MLCDSTTAQSPPPRHLRVWEPRSPPDRGAAHSATMRLVPAAGRSSVPLKDAVLVMPAVAFANVGELAVDVLVTTLGAQLAARLDSPNLLACVGNNAYQPQPPGLLATAAELYHVPGSRVFLLQQRAPAIPGRQRAFAAEVAAWAAAEGIGHILLLSALDAQYRREQQLEGPQLRYLAAASTGGAAQGEVAAPPTPGIGGAAAAAGAAAGAPPTRQLQALQLGEEGAWDSCCRAAGLKQLEGDVITTEREVHGLLPPWPLLDASVRSGLQCTLLSTFAAEGDNTHDSLQLAGKVLAVLQQQAGLLPQAGAAAGGNSDVTAALKVPCSWSASLFGRQPFDSQLF